MAIPLTRVDIAKVLGFKSPNAGGKITCGRWHVKGAIEIDAPPRVTRPFACRIRLIDAPEIAFLLIGRVAAGAPVWPWKTFEDHCQIDPASSAARRLSAACASMSMRDIAFSTVTCSQCTALPFARNGQMSSPGSAMRSL